jgi:linoleoyl-CoA desaturase
VNQRVEAIPENRDIYIQIKAIILPLIYLGLYVFALFNVDQHWVYISSFVLMGISLVLIYLNLIHEAAHNNIYKSKRLNSLVCTFSILWEPIPISGKKTYRKPSCLSEC